MFRRTSERMVIMSRYTPEAVKYAPLYIHSFRLVQPHTLVEAEKFNIRYTEPSQIHNTPDKLRWHRYRLGLRQRDVADRIGIDRSTYSTYEEAGRDYYPIKVMAKLAELFNLPVTELLDEFNLFLYYGQGEQIRQMRQSRGMTQKEYAGRIGVPLGSLKKWEQNRVTISKSNWENLRMIG